MSSFFAQGYKCTSCHLVFHAKCVQASGSSQALPTTVLECGLPQTTKPTAPAPAITSVAAIALASSVETDPSGKNRKASRDTIESVTGVVLGVATGGPVSSSSEQSSKWNLTGTSQFTDSTQDVVNGGQQLHRLDEFIGRKIQTLDDTRGDADRVFLSALRQLRGIYNAFCL